MRIFIRFFTIIGLLTLGLAPANAQTIQQALRFKILPPVTIASFWSGNPNYPGDPTNFGTTHSFTVTTDLDGGFRIEVDPGPSQDNDSGYTFFLVIYVDGVPVTELNLGGLGTTTAEAVIGSQGFDEGQHIVLTGEYRKPGKETTVVTMRWPFDENSITYKENSCIYCDVPSFIYQYGPYAFDYQPTAIPPTLTFNTVGTGYKPYPIPTGTAPAGYTDPIAANYGTGLVFNVGTNEGPDLVDATSALYYDDGSGSNGVLDTGEDGDTLIYANSQGAFEAVALTFPLNDPGRVEEGLYFLLVKVFNVFNLSTEIIVPISSLRALDWPTSVTWDLGIATPAGTLCTYEDLATHPGTVNYKTVHEQHEWPCNISANANDLTVNLIEYSDANRSYDYDASVEIDFDVRLLLSKRSNCTPTSRYAIAPTSVGGGIYNFPEVENDLGNPRYVWGVKADLGYPDGDYVELGLVEMVDQRSGKRLPVEGLDLSSGGNIGNGWPIWTPKHRLRLLGERDLTACQSFDFAFYEAASCANEISELDFISGQNLEFSLKPSLPAGSSTYVHYVYVTNDDGPLDFTLIGGMPTIPTSGVCYPFEIQMLQSVDKDFKIRFELIKDGSIFIAKEIYVNVEPAPTEPVINNISYVSGDPSVELLGAVDFHFGVDFTWSEQPVSVRWRWNRSNAPRFWLETGNWGSTAGSLEDIGPTGTDFSGHWGFVQGATSSNTQINWVTGDYLSYMANFFDGLNSQMVTVEVELVFPGGQTVSATSDPLDPFVITLEPSPNALGSAEVGYYGITGKYETLTYNVGKQDELRFILAPQKNETLDISLVRFSLAGGNREPLSGNFAPPELVDGTYVLKGPTGLLSPLADEGIHRLIFYPNSDLTETGMQVIVQAIAPEPVLVRYHLRDHIGSSAKTQTFRSFPAHVQNVDNFILAGTSFYDHAYSETRYEPFGERLNENVAEETKARYTDHEFDDTTGFNYMKGRFQLANYAKFNRPDPKRDWDWLKPQTINLYEYVGNDPINAWDPDGFSKATVERILKAIDKKLNQAYKRSAEKNGWEMEFLIYETRRGKIKGTKVRATPERTGGASLFFSPRRACSDSRSLVMLRPIKRCQSTLLGPLVQTFDQLSEQAPPRKSQTKGLGHTHEQSLNGKKNNPPSPTDVAAGAIMEKENVHITQTDDLRYVVESNDPDMAKAYLSDLTEKGTSVGDQAYTFALDYYKANPKGTEEEARLYALTKLAKVLGATIYRTIPGENQTVVDPIV